MTFFRNVENLEHRVTNSLWKKMTQGELGYITYGLLGIVFAFVLFQVLSVVLGTSLPIVAVVSGSMDHGVTDLAGDAKYPCGEQVENYVENFDNWWTACGFTYASEFGISKEQFREFPYSDGFKIGDMPIIGKSGDYAVGDIIVYNVDSQSFPIIHRIVKINEDGTFQTKGDHNDGQNAYELSIEESQVEGKVIFIIPKIGYLKVGFNRLIGL